MKDKIIVVAGILVLVFSCRNDKSPSPQTTSASDCDTTVYFIDDIMPILESKCSTTPGCHTGGYSHGDFTTYNGVKAKVENGSIEKTVFTEKTMPQPGNPPLTEYESKKLNCWLNQGYPNNSKSPVAASACTTTISYSLNIAPIISANCSSVNVCHGSGSVNGDYTVYANLKSKADNGSLNYRVVVLKDMPPISAPNLLPEDISKIDCWIQQGAPNN